MATFALVGSDTIKINQRLITDLPHGEVAKITYETDLATVKTGKNGNTIFAQNASGFAASLELKVLRGSADDKFMQSLVTLYRANPTGYVLINSELVKRVGDGLGNVTADAYVLTGGIPTKQIEVMTNVEGDVEQSVCSYMLKFAYSERAIA